MKIKYGGKEYPIVFNINVLEEIQKKYTTMDKWQEKITGKNPDMTAIKEFFLLAINEAIDEQNDLQGTEMPFITDKQAGRMMGNLAEMQGTIFDLVTQSTKGDEEEGEGEESKNDQSRQTQS